MLDEQFEFRLTQYLDGTLPVDEAGAFFAELAKSPEALAMLDEYRKLDLVLKAQPTEAINWDGLAEDIGAEIDEQSRNRWKISGFRPMRIAIAALVALTVGVAAQQMMQYRKPQHQGPAAVARITGPTIEVAAAPAVSQIEIGPDSGQAVVDITYHYADLVPRPARVVIASGVVARQDERSLPY